MEKNKYEGKKKMRGRVRKEERREGKGGGGKES
jgi:hypothetical protein